MIIFLFLLIGSSEAQLDPESALNVSGRHEKSLILRFCFINTF